MNDTKERTARLERRRMLARNRYRNDEAYRKAKNKEDLERYYLKKQADLEKKTNY